MLKFIHIGDVHLDTTFYSRESAIREKLRGSLRMAFLEVIEACILEKVDALLIAGDLFDNHQLSFQTEELLIKSFNRLNEHNIKVFYATGNHDPGEIRSRVGAIRWPDNVMVFANDEICDVDVSNLQGEIIGKIISVGHKTNRESRNLVQEFPVKRGDIPHVGLVHAMVTNASDVEKHDRYLPCTKEDLLEKGYDFWALGHIHQYQEIGEATNIYYSGNLQGRHPRETGEKGGLLVTIEENGLTKVEFKNFAKVIWSTLSVDQLEEMTSYNQMKDYLVDLATNHLEGGYAPSRMEGILRVELKGRCPLREELHEEENIRQLEEDLKYHFNLLSVEVKTEELLPLQNVEDYRDGDNVLAKILAFLEEVQEVVEEGQVKGEVRGEWEENPLLERLLKLPFANKGMKTNAEKLQYISKLLKGLPEQAVHRMVVEDQ
ncbi:metallophosphoesterase family protein [Alkaliphilus hydrothermalis]|uniref:DNA repair exonuclease SbcCD nuclease subunit n=1 Tax=Alkaliphilus hydrothermalis TaxID=1482730 RepID=A0ABS2NSL0_9FIRM|nr:DNA repair exonuclease [Alkaliphilus hydrothermalis]MBM7615944.1 DNA repair exonuclease SbcCD nuclease subunit [Alkaliphilus hydrothermalis]